MLTERPSRHPPWNNFLAVFTLTFCNRLATESFSIKTVGKGGVAIW
jgi:hypothetical protein